MIENFIDIHSTLQKLHTPEFGKVGIRLKRKSEQGYYNYNISFTLEEDNFCCGSYNFGDFHIYDNYYEQNYKEYLTLLKEIFEKILVRSKYTSQRTNILCTMINGRNKSILEDVGFKVISEFTNSKTGETVYIMNYIINHKNKFRNNDDEDEDFDEYEDFDEDEQENDDIDI